MKLFEISSYDDFGKYFPPTVQGFEKLYRRGGTELAGARNYLFKHGFYYGMDNLYYKLMVFRFADYLFHNWNSWGHRHFDSKYPEFLPTPTEFQTGFTQYGNIGVNDCFGALSDKLPNMDDDEWRNNYEYFRRH